MSLLSPVYPSLIHPARHCANGHYPEQSFYAQAVAGLNHVTAYRRKLVYRKAWKLAHTGGASGVVARWHCKTGAGARRLVVLPVLGFDDRAVASDPYIDVAITKVGGATTTLTFHGGATSAISNDAPEWWLPQIQAMDVDASSSYTGSVTYNDNARVISLMVFEEYVPTVDEALSPFCEWEPGAGSPIFDNRQSQLLAGIGSLIRGNQGLRADWSHDDGTIRTRSSSVLANPFDNTSPPASTPDAASPGWTFATQYRNTYGASTIPILLCAYGSIPAGSGTVRLRDTAGTDHATVTINNNSAQWFTAVGSLPASATVKVDPLYAGDNVNILSLHAISVYAIQ